jgi:hypothetical protein
MIRLDNSEYLQRGVWEQKATQDAKSGFAQIPEWNESDLTFTISSFMRNAPRRMLALRIREPLVTNQRHVQNPWQNENSWLPVIFRLRFLWRASSFRGASAPVEKTKNAT